jgi:hypothetical protein
MKHKIEESVAVYLNLAEDESGARTWVMDPVTIDGDELCSNYEHGPSTDGCDCGGDLNPDSECQQLADQAAEMHLPSAVELTVMLVESIMRQGGDQAAELRKLLQPSMPVLR